MSATVEVPHTAPADLARLQQHVDYHAKLTHARVAYALLIKERLDVNSVAAASAVERLAAAAAALPKRHSCVVQATDRSLRNAVKRTESDKTAVMVTAAQLLTLARICDEAHSPAPVSVQLAAALATAKSEQLGRGCSYAQQLMRLTLSTLSHDVVPRHVIRTVSSVMQRFRRGVGPFKFTLTFLYLAAGHGRIAWLRHQVHSHPFSQHRTRDFTLRAARCCSRSERKVVRLLSAQWRVCAHNWRSRDPSRALIIPN